MACRSDRSLTHRAMRQPASGWLAACALALTLAGGAPSATAADAPPYASLRIVSPVADASIRDNRGMVRVVVRLAPPLRVDSGDRLTLSLDGHATTPLATTAFVFTQVDRGTHTVQAQVLSENGAILIQSDPVVFHLHQASRLAPRRN